MSTKKKRKMSNNSTPVSQTFAIWLGGQRQRSFLFSVRAEGTRRAQRKERDFLSTGRDVFVLFQTPAPGHTQQPDRWQLDGRRRRRHRFWQTKKQPGDARSNLRAWKRGRRSAEEVKLMPFSCWPDAGARRKWRHGEPTGRALQTQQETFGRTRDTLRSASSAHSRSPEFLWSSACAKKRDPLSLRPDL